MGTPPIMSDAPVVIHHLNIYIYPSTLFSFENIGHKYDFEGVGWFLLGSESEGVGPSLRKQTFSTK